MTEWNNTFGEQTTTALAVITAATTLTVLSIFWLTRKSQKKLLEDPEVKYEVALIEKEVRNPCQSSHCRLLPLLLLMHMSEQKQDKARGHKRARV